jgi:hypothetical protein
MMKIMDSDIFLITSVINTGSHAWSYTSVRSTYTPQQRFEQTLKTIESIRKLADGSRIILAECSKLDTAMEEKLKSEADIYFQLYDIPDIREACLNSDKKGYGELLQTKHVVNYLTTTNMPFRRMFKISGRYFLNESFNKNLFSDSEFSFREPFPNSINYPTVLYSVPNAFLSRYSEAIATSHEEFKADTYRMFELSLPSKCNPVATVKTCGVSGLVAVDNSFYEDVKK